MRPASVLVKRKRALVELRGTPRVESWENFESALRPYESVLTEVLDPVRAPELVAVREQIRSWRFYDQFRTDADSPIRQSQIGTRTPVLDAEAETSRPPCRRSSKSATPMRYTARSMTLSAVPNSRWWRPAADSISN